MNLGDRFPISNLNNQESVKTKPGDRSRGAGLQAANQPLADWQCDHKENVTRTR